MQTDNATQNSSSQDSNSQNQQGGSQQNFRALPAEGKRTSNKTDVLAILAAWLIALALVYMAIIRISIKFH